MSKKEIKHSEKGLNRRDFLKFGSAGAALGAVALAGTAKKAAAKAVNEGAKKSVVKTQDDFPHEIREDYQPLPSYSTVHGHAFFGGPLMALGVNVDMDSFKKGQKYLHHVNYEYDNSRKGFDQISKAITGGAWALSNSGAGPSPGAVGDYGLMSWDNNSDKYPLALMDTNFVHKEKYEFESKKEASDAIKRAARLYGADLIGITRRAVVLLVPA